MTNIVIRGALIGDADAISHLIIQTDLCPPNQALLESLVLVVGEIVTKLAVSRVINVVFTGLSR